MLTISSYSPAGAHKCQVENVKRTFIQLWDKDSQRSVEEWEKQFSELKDIGFSELILQWSSYGWTDKPTANFVDDTYSEIYLSNIIQAAKIQGIKVWIGLHYDPSWWDRIEANDNLTQEYLNFRLIKTSSKIQQLSEIIKINNFDINVIAGWYISDEIDDVNWNTKNRFNLLSNYFSSISHSLNQEDLNLPIMISSFSNGNLSSVELSDFITKITKQSNIDILLFQDGIGVNKLSLQQLKKYLPPLSFNLKKANKSLGLIVELFQLQSNNNLVTSSYSQIAEQISIAEKWSNEYLTVFSAFDNLLAKNKPRTKALLKRWQREYLKCISHDKT